MGAGFAWDKHRAGVCGVRERSVAAVWVAGLCLAAWIYAVGPDRFLWSAFDFLDQAAAALQNVLVHLSDRAFDMLRAGAIALFAVFWGLAVAARRRGMPVGGAMFWVTLLFLVLVWRQGPGQTGHWFLAFVLAAAAAGSVTRRLAGTGPVSAHAAPPSRPWQA
jgi:hypothetical protein